MVTAADAPPRQTASLTQAVIPLAAIAATALLAYYALPPLIAALRPVVKSEAGKLVRGLAAQVGKRLLGL
jgi:hypothetical protein